MSTKFYTLLTEIGAAKLANAAALGVPLKITQMAVGDGAGSLPVPNAQQTQLVGEKRRAGLNQLYIDPQNASQIIAEQIIPENEGGWWIREVGLFDESGAMIAVGNCAESYKPLLAEGSGRTQTVRMILITRSADNITLKIDPSIVLATRKYVDDKVIELSTVIDRTYAPIESPDLSGKPTAPTADAGDNSKQIATTEFVQYAIAARLPSFEKLRKLTPMYAGQRVLLAAWNENIKPYGQSSFGGGEFVAIQGSAADDGGYIARVSDDWYWMRVKDTSEATIKDFGAIPDGVTRCDDALRKMFVWAYGSDAQSNIDTLAQTVNKNKGMVQFGHGQFAIGNVDLTQYGRKQAVKFYGDLTGDHKNLRTTLHLVAGSGFAVTAYFLQCEIAGFNLIGQYETNTADSCGFLDNRYAQAPQTLRARAFHIQNVGGCIFNLTDTMDTEISQIYMENGTSSLVRSRWSGNPTGGWDHTTAVALRDISVWNIKKNSVFFIPRCHQSEIQNVWISECDKPGNISQGDWKFTGVFQLEGNKEHFYAQETHIVGNQPGTQGEFGISYSAGNSEIPSEWDNNAMGVPSYVADPSWERGRTYITPTGLEAYYGSVQANYFASRNTIRNNNSSAVWYKLGDVFLPGIGQSCDITVMGVGGFDSAEGRLEHTYDTGFGGGKAIISIQNKGGNKAEVTWYGMNSNAVTGVKYVGGASWFTIYVQIRAFSPSQSVFVQTDAPARTDEGLHFKWDFHGEPWNMDTVQNLLNTHARFMVGNGSGTGGMGIDMDEGTLILGVNLQNLPSKDLDTQGVPIWLNGTKYYLPLIKG